MSNWLARAKKEGTPLIDGNRATFVWEGEKAPYLHFGFQTFKFKKVVNNISINQFFDLHSDAYIEYSYHNEKKKLDTSILDPFNKRLIKTSSGYPLHYFSMPERQHTPLIKRKRGIERGEVTKHIIENIWEYGGGKRTVWLYLPAIAFNESVPLLLVFDGNNYRKHGRIVEIVDNLIAEKRIRPIAMAMVDNGKNYHFMEYHENETTLRFITHYVLHLVYSADGINVLNTGKNSGAFGVLGSSMGGMMALYTGLRLPHIFGYVISQAGDFSTGGSRQKPTATKQWIEHMPVAPIKIWLDVGYYDLSYVPCQAIHKLLTKKGYDVNYYEHNGGHNYTSWRDALPEALISIFGE